MKQLLKKGSTDQSVIVFIPDSSSTTGAGKTGLAYNTASLVCYYVRPGSAAAQLTLATQTVTGAHSDGGFVEIDATNMPGVYRLDLSDAILATGVNSAIVMLQSAANMAPVVLEIELTDFDLHTATPKVDLDTIKTQSITCAAGVTVLASVGTSATSTAQTGDAYARLGAPAGASVSADVAAVKAETANIVADTNELQTDLANGGRLDLLIDSILEDTGTTLDGKINTIDGIVDDILIDTAVIGAAGAGLTAIPWNAAWDAEVQSECTDALNAYDPPTNAEMEARTLAFADYATATNLATVDTVVDAVKAVTDKLDTALELDGAVYRYTENALEQAPSGSGLDAAGVRAAIGLASANLDTQLDALPTAAEVTDAVWDEALSGHTGSGTAGLALSTASSGGVDPSVLADAIWDEALSGHSSAGTAGKKLTDLANADLSGVATAAALTTIDGIVDDIKAKTDNLPAAPAAVGSAMTLTVAYDAAKSAASQTSVNAIPVNPLLTNDARLNNLDAAISSRSSQTSVDTVDGIVDAILEDTAQIGSAGAGLTAIPWNAAWDDEVQSECTDALNAYDPPTKTEMDARTLVAASYATAAALATAKAAIDAIPTGTLLADDARLDNLDATVSSRLAGDDYTAPDNAGIAALTIAGNDINNTINRTLGDHGTVSQAAMKISAVDGTAFVDFGLPAVLTNGVAQKAKLTITDSTGKKLVGYIKAAGTGETLGANVLTNGDMESFTGWEQGHGALSAETTDKIEGAQSGKFTLTGTSGSGYFYRQPAWSLDCLYAIDGFIKNLTIDTISLFIEVGPLDNRNNRKLIFPRSVPPSTWTEFSGYYTLPTSSVVFLVYAFGLSGNAWLTDNVTIKQVLTPSTTGVTITSTPDGTTYNWASKESGFDYNDASGYSYTIFGTLATIASAIRTELATDVTLGLQDVADEMEAVKDAMQAANIPLHGKVWNYTCTNSATGMPIQGVKIVASTDEAGLNAVAEGYTDAFGVARLYLVPGTYYIWRFKPGFNAINPDVEVVT